MTLTGIEAEEVLAVLEAVSEWDGRIEDSEWGFVTCRFCSAHRDWREADLPLEHHDDCVIVRARRLIARLGGSTRPAGDAGAGDGGTA